MRTVFERSTAGISMYMHPYDATEYNDGLENSGQEFRQRTEALLNMFKPDLQFVTASDLM